MPRLDRSRSASRQEAADGRAAGDAVLTAGKGLSYRWLGQPVVGREATAVAYLRRSSDRQGQSLADQRQAIRRHAGEAGLRVVREYVDDAVSGADSAGRRAFHRLMRDAQAPHCEFGIVLVFDVSRFGRVDNDEAGHYRWLLRQAGVSIRYVAESLPGGPLDDLIRPVRQWHAREELAHLSRITVRGMLSRWNRGIVAGQWMGGFPPHGYDLRHEDVAGRLRFTIRYMPDGTRQIRSPRGRTVRQLARGVTLPEMASDIVRLTPSAQARVRTVHLIYSMRVREGHSASEIATILQHSHIPTSRGPHWSGRCTGEWRAITVRNIIRNPAYAGDLVWNRRTLGRIHRISSGGATPRDDAAARRTSLNPPQDWLVTRDCHPPLVARDLWIAAQFPD